MAPISLRKGVVDKLAGDLVKSITGLEENTKNHELSMQYTLSNFRFHRFLDVNSLNIKRKINGLIQKLTIHSQHDKAQSLEGLVDKYLARPYSTSLDATETDAHFSVISVLLELSDSPIHHEYEPGESKKTVKEKDIDWTSYLLASKEILSLGVPMDPIIMVALDDSDDEFLSDGEREGREPTASLSASQRQELLRTTSKDEQVWTAALEKGEGIAEIDYEDYHWLEENVTPSYWKPFHLKEYDFGKSESVSALCSVAYNWEMYKQENDSYPQTPCGKMLTEKLIVRETLWALQGVTDLYLYKLIDKKVYVSEDVILSHVTKETLHSFLECFADQATTVHLIKEFVLECFRPSSHYSKTFRAFGSAVATFMKIRCKNLSKIEEEMIKSEATWTLSSLKEKLSSDFSVVTCIFHLLKIGVQETIRTIPAVPEQVIVFLDAFYDLICAQDTLGVNGSMKLSVLLPIFVETIKPHLEDVDHWMMYGELTSKGRNEFFIYRLETSSQPSAQYWQKTFQLRVSENEKEVKRISVTKFLLPVVSQILLAGKSLGLLQDFGKLISEDLSKRIDLHEEFLNSLCELCHVSLKGDEREDTPFEPRYLYMEQSLVGQVSKQAYSPFLALNSRLLSISVSESENEYVNDTERLLNAFGALRGCEICPVPVSLVIGQSLYPFINSRYEKASALLLNLLKNEFGLFEHVTKLQEFLLLGAGDVLRLFYHEIFQKARFSGFWQDVSYLNIVLQDALQAHYPEMIGRLTVGLRTLSEGKKTASQVQALDSLSLHFEVPWPMSIIFDSDTEARYNVIFRFLLQVKRALWSLEQLRFNDLAATSKEKNTVSTVELNRVCHQMFLFRMRLLHFIQGLHQYIMTRILHSTRLELERELARVKDLDEILVIHNDYLEKIFDRCLLNQKVGFAKEAVIRILNVALELQVKWDKGIDENSEEEMESLESEFSKCTKYLLTFLKNLVKRGTFPHLEMLAVALK